MLDQNLTIELLKLVTIATPALQMWIEVSPKMSTDQEGIHNSIKMQSSNTIKIVHETAAENTAEICAARQNIAAAKAMKSTKIIIDANLTSIKS